MVDALQFDPRKTSGWEKPPLLSDSPFVVRRATAGDIECLTTLRVALLNELGNLGPGDDAAPIVRALRTYFHDALASGEFIAWLAEANGEVVSASGLTLARTPPTARDLSGLQAYVMNMYTVPEWRQTGASTQLLNALLDFARVKGVHCVWLRATPDGRPIYERAGFRDSGHYMELMLPGNAGGVH